MNSFCCSMRSFDSNCFALGFQRALASISSRKLRSFWSYAGVILELNAALTPRAGDERTLAARAPLRGEAAREAASLAGEGPEEAAEAAIPLRSPELLVLAAVGFPSAAFEGGRGSVLDLGRGMVLRGIGSLDPGTRVRLFGGSFSAGRRGV